MELSDTLIKLNNIIKQLKQFHNTSLDLKEGKKSEILKKESCLLTKLVNCFHEILSDNLIIKKEDNPKEAENSKHYWNFISKHFNTNVVIFCKQYENDEKNEEHPSLQKGKMWILFSILENSFYDSINEIYNKGLHKNYGEKSILNKNKFEIKHLLKELNELNFHNIMSKEYEKYLDFAKNNINKSYDEKRSFEKEFNSAGSPIFGKRQLSHYISERKNSGFFLNFCDASYPNEVDCFYFGDNENDFKDFIEDDLKIILPENQKAEEDEDKNYSIEIIRELSPNLNCIFYSFKPNKSKNIIEDKKIEIEDDKNDEENYISSVNSLSDIFNLEANYLNNINEEKKEKNEKYKCEIVLNPKNPKHLPTDNYYELNQKNPWEYNINDVIIYRKKKRPISNCLLFYLNKYYKKASYHTFIEHNLKNRSISLKDQNYQCQICLRKIPIFLGIPKESVFWCSYYMRYVCKNCIDNEMSIIPHFVLKMWCFKKFTISKKAKQTLEKWYNKPIIVFDKNDKIFEKNTQLNRVINIKRIINLIINKMKCKNIFKFIEETMGEYDYIALKEDIFSLKGLVEINNNTFINKMNEFKNKFIQHISSECQDCKYEGETCNICNQEPKVFFYNFDDVTYCKICKKSFHKKCTGTVGHIH